MADSDILATKLPIFRMETCTTDVHSTLAGFLADLVILKCAHRQSLPPSPSLTIYYAKARSSCTYYVHFPYGKKAWKKIPTPTPYCQNYSIPSNGRRDLRIIKGVVAVSSSKGLKKIIFLFNTRQALVQNYE